MMPALLGPYEICYLARENNRHQSFSMVSSQLNDCGQLCCVCRTRTAGPKPLVWSWKVVATVANRVLAFSYAFTLEVKDRFSWLPWSVPARRPHGYLAHRCLGRFHTARQSVSTVAYLSVVGAGIFPPNAL